MTTKESPFSLDDDDIEREDYCVTCNHLESQCTCPPDEDDGERRGAEEPSTFGFCTDPDCIMPGEHLIPIECHTAQMMEDYSRAAEAEERAARAKR